MIERIQGNLSGNYLMLIVHPPGQSLWSMKWEYSEHDDNDKLPLKTDQRQELTYIISCRKREVEQRGEKPERKRDA